MSLYDELDKILDGYRIPYPTHEDSFWQNNLIAELRRKVREFEKKWEERLKHLKGTTCNTE